MTTKIHSVSTAVLGALVCLLATGQESNGTASERGAAQPLAYAKESLAKPTAEAKVAPARSPPASAPKTVADRKAETLEAMRKRELVPAGHGSPAPVP
jgi:hypothetical protein